MKLFTLSATPVRVGLTELENDNRIKEYPGVVASTLQHHGFDGFTIYKVDGYWEGVAEVSYKIEIAVDKDPERVYTIAKQLRDIYDQDSVMLTLPDNSVKFI